MERIEYALKDLSMITLTALIRIVRLLYVYIVYTLLMNPKRAVTKGTITTIYVKIYTLYYKFK